MIEQQEQQGCEFCLDEPSKSNNGRIVITVDAEIGGKTYHCRYCGETETFVNGVRITKNIEKI